MGMLASIMLITYAIIIMSLVLDFRPQSLPPKKQLAAILYALLVILENGVAMLLLGQQQYGKYYLFLVQLPVFIGFSLFSRYRGIKLFFVLLSIIIFSSPPIMCVTMLRTFYQIDMATSLVAFFCCYLLMILLVYYFLKPDFNYMLENCESRHFWLFCLIPMLNYIYSFARTGYDFTQPFAREGYFVRQIPTLIVLASYILLIRVFRTTRENQQLESEKGIISLQRSAAELQLHALRASQEQAILYRHDMWHHLSLLEGLAQQGELDKIKEYLSGAEQELKMITPTRFCENETLNLIISAFQHKAEQEKIVLSVKAELPGELHVPDTALCAVLSNGLKNALSAVSKVTDSTLRKVFLECSVERNMLLLEIENTYVGALLMKDNMPTTTEAGHGYGCLSVRAIAEKRGGFCTFKAEHGVFTLRVALPMEKELAAVP